MEQALDFRDRGALLVDVRTPAEFAEATIPGAINIPIFSNEERAEIGTMYKQVSKQDARMRGIELVAPKIPEFIRAVQAAAEGRAVPVVVFCWRGGERSRAMTSFLEFAGIPARQLEGGHKAFRRHVLEYFEKPEWGRLLVLRGMTGVGKTTLLHRLADAGYPVIDLEGLANHRGSAFGNLGLPPQPGQKMFESLVWDELRKISRDGYVLVEGESRHIGRVALPKNLHDAMQVETSIWLNLDLDRRVECILDDYPARDDLRDAFEPPIRALKERLGKQRVEEMLALLHDGQWQQLVRELMVDYYDTLYRHTFPEQRIELEVDPETGTLAPLEEAIRTILEDGRPGSVCRQGGV
ncbi:MAG: tRNA 2-selenouridine(34) synthase MnmH [Desulfuromonas sp.]|nr:MAG: tRNA 2-selenouridine(34) synthase MnmH [Desulfuromonas sp.]